MTTLTRLDRWEDIPAAISQMQLAGAGHRVPLLQALYRGEIAYAEMRGPGYAGYASRFRRWAATIRLPGIALIGDDGDTSPDGPDAWPVARRVLGWARFILVHGAAGHPDHYRYAIGLARTYDRLLLIECASRNIGPWEQACERSGPGAVVLVMRPPPGVPHPVPRRAGGLN